MDSSILIVCRQSLFGRERAEREQTMAPLYENSRGRDDRGNDTTFLARPQAGRASAGPSYTKHDFTSLLPDGLGPETSSSSKALDMDKRLDFSRAGAELIRSQSAAPTFHGRNQLFPPPGLADIKESQPTPSTVDSYSSSHSNGNSTYESAVDRGADIMKLGQRRPASTSAIGNGGLYSSPAGGGGALRSNALMGLIEEDAVPDSSRGGVQQENFDDYHPHDNRHQQTQTSSHMQQRLPGGEPQYIYTQQPQPHHGQPHHIQHQPPHNQQHLQQPQYVHRGDPHHEPRMQQPMQQQQQLQQQPLMRTARDHYDVTAPMGAPTPMGAPMGAPMVRVIASSHNFLQFLRR